MAETDLELALRLADAADEITLARFGSADLAVQTKPDRTPVTEADREVERLLRSAIERHRPGEAVLGEEFGASGDSDRRWIVDPVDGTKNYLRGVPVWATLLARQEAGRVTLGVVSAPALARRWWASRGGGAWASFAGAPPRRCRVSGVAELPEAFLAYSSRPGWAATGRAGGFDALVATVARSRGFGDFLSHVLVAEGAVDVSCEPEVALWDLAALQVIVEEAGGRFTDLSGQARADGGSAVASNALLHPAVLQMLDGR